MPERPLSEIPLQFNTMLFFFFSETTATVGLLSLTPGGGAVFEYTDGESNATVWPEGIPADGTVHRRVERFPYAWLVVISYFFNSVVILAALLCLLFTLVFHNRK